MDIATLNAVIADVESYMDKFDPKSVAFAALVTQRNRIQGMLFLELQKRDKQATKIEYLTPVSH